MEKGKSDRADQKITFVKVVSYYIRRARAQLKRFDEDEHESLFYAALELRIGIEARLHECIKSSRKTRKLPQRPVNEYHVKQLLRELAHIDPESDKPARITITIGRSPSFALKFEYVPISPALAKAHGQIGDLLHYTVFERHPRFFQPTETKAISRKSWTIIDYRHWLFSVCDELERVTSGGLISHPVWNEMADQLLDIEDSTDPESGERIIEVREKPFGFSKQGDG